MSSTSSTHTNISKTKCDIHEQNVYNMFCVDCDYLVCSKCTQRQHQNHATTEISADIILKKRTDLEEKVTEVKNKQKPELEKEVEKLQHTQHLYSLEIQDCITRVKNQGESLKHAVDKVTESYIEELLHQEKKDIKRLKNTENKLMQKLSGLNDLIERSEETLVLENGMELVKFSSDSLQMVQRLTQQEEKVMLAPPTFHSREINTKEIKNLFGDIKREIRTNMEEIMWFATGNSKNQETIPHIKAKVITSFENMQSINCLCAINESEAWIGGYNYVTMVTRNGRKYKSIKVDFSVNDVAKCKSGDLLVATDSEIKKILTNGDVIRFADVTPYTAQGIFINKDGNIFSCLRSEIEGKVVKVSNRGQVTQNIQYDKDGTLLFTKPGFITCTDNENIWVTDEFDNSVAVVNKHGEFQFKYTGPSDVKLRSPFSPKDLATLRGEQVLVSDCRNHAIHLLDNLGHFIQFVMTSDDGLRGPRTVNVDPFGYIWVSCWYNNAVIVAKYSK